MLLLLLVEVSLMAILEPCTQVLTIIAAQFFLSCGQLNVVNGGSGKPGPLVAIPGVYTGNESGLLINIYYPIPTSWTQPGPVSISKVDLKRTLLSFGDRLFGADK